MRILLVIFLVCAGFTLGACGLNRTNPFAIQTGIRAKCKPYYAGLNNCSGLFTGFSMCVKHDMISIMPLSVVTIYRISLDDGAIFCRMESFTQRNYGVKFSFHAGGYAG